MILVFKKYLYWHLIIISNFSRRSPFERKLVFFVVLEIFLQVQGPSPYRNRHTHRGRRGRDRMVVGFATTYAISAYHH